MDKYPEDWRDRPLFPGWPTDQPRDVYQLGQDGEPWNTIWCAYDIAKLIWPDGEGTVWAVSPCWCPWGEVWDGVSLEPPPPPGEPVDPEPEAPPADPVDETASAPA